MVLDHVLDLIGAEDRDENAAGWSRQRGNIVNRQAAQLGKTRAPLGVDVKPGNGNPGTEQATGIDLAHQPKTNDGNRMIVHGTQQSA